MLDIVEVEDPFFDPDAAALRVDEVVCPECHYTHFFRLDKCPTCKLYREGR